MNTCSQPRCKRPSCSSSAPIMRPREERCLDTLPLAMAYVPMQRFKNMYELDEGLQYGTIFPELNKPFTGWKGGRPC